ncbi:MAG: pseudouridine synthase [Aestuariivita sp.]|nr:pseudouridine synthase [Aestuariivita sp.]
MTKTARDGERIAKRLARTGIASRREIERMIMARRIKVNGQTIASPAKNITDRDHVQVDGVSASSPSPPKLWRFHKPIGTVTTERDPNGRPTIFDYLPDHLPRVLYIGRLDYKSEGLLLLTNDGGLKRRLELPTNNWLRRYRVRVKGTPTEAKLDELRSGLILNDERFKPMQVTVDRQQRSNAWLTIGLREGKHREIRRALAHCGLSVNRLIRISFGPFQLGSMKAGNAKEVSTKVLRDQLGLES